ncbi:ABC transporter ATP-binding protein [Luteibaculum oceani]|uniref:ABC transporter ATP-binding protein n=1 Tax=Luteibaculum oceani TaxID=1294296 RepID=A0A5C6V127_9FLAO|nr:ABC transporter ATP-binding protein [Luteibaculum oceani]TXC78664.1 ABC transporter ATP-binding protein [Luteibaculum oceani]
MELLRAKNISKSYGNNQVLKPLDLTINKGDFISITGPSGAGKTTLLQILGTLEKPSDGEVLFNGSSNPYQLKEKQLAAFRSNHLGFVFQFHQLLPEFTAIENIMLPALIAGKAKKEAENKALELLDLLGISNQKDQKPSTMSGGERQRAAVARALINEPDIVFADEPSGNLDSENAEKLHHIFKELQESITQTFIVVTHNEKLAQIADRVLVLRDGVLQF